MVGKDQRQFYQIRWPNFQRNLPRTVKLERLSRYAAWRWLFPQMGNSHRKSALGENLSKKSRTALGGPSYVIGCGVGTWGEQRCAAPYRRTRLCVRAFFVSVVVGSSIANDSNVRVPSWTSCLVSLPFWAHQRH